MDVIDVGTHCLLVICTNNYGWAIMLMQCLCMFLSSPMELLTTRTWPFCHDKKMPERYLILNEGNC